MMQISEKEAFRACRVLFGSDLTLNRSFLTYLQASGAHSAFRKQAKTTHPDGQHRSSREDQNQVKLFQDLNQAYQLVQSYLRQRDLAAARSRNSTASKPSKPTNSHSRHSYSREKQGPLPTRPLQFGLFLYYRGFIPFNAILGALVWQRKQRPTMGEIAQRWGWIEQQEIEKILTCNMRGRFGERAESLGLLSPLQIRAILLHQRTRQGKIGSYFTEQGLLSVEEVNHLLGDLSDHNLKYRHGHSDHFYYHR